MSDRFGQMPDPVDLAHQQICFVQVPVHLTTGGVEAGELSTHRLNGRLLKSTVLSYGSNTLVDLTVHWCSSTAEL